MKKLIKLALVVVSLIAATNVSYAAGVPAGGNCAGWPAFSEGEEAYTGTINGSPQNQGGVTHFNCTFAGHPPAGIKLTGSEHWISIPNKDGAKIAGLDGYVAVSDRTINAAQCTSDVVGAAATTPQGLAVLQAAAKSNGCGQ
jgi:hypothetical protein